MHVMHVSLTRKSSQRVEYSDGHEVLQTDVKRHNKEIAITARTYYGTIEMSHISI